MNEERRGEEGARGGGGGEEKWIGKDGGKGGRKGGESRGCIRDVTGEHQYRIHTVLMTVMAIIPQGSRFQS